MLRILICLVLTSAPAWAQGGSAEEIAAQANAEYKAGNHLKAVELYREAYGISRATAILYNIALIYDRKLDDEALAMEFYRQYLAAPDADPKAASKATVRLQELKAEVAKAEAAARAAEEKRRQEEATRRAEEEARRAAAPAVVEVAPVEDSGVHLGGLITTVAGAALIGTGVYFGLDAGAKADDFEGSQSLNKKKQLRDDGEQSALVADVLYGVGGAAVIAGVVIMLVADGDGPTVGAGLTADGTGAGVWLGGSL